LTLRITTTAERTKEMMNFAVCGRGTFVAAEEVEEKLKHKR